VKTQPRPASRKTSSSRSGARRAPPPVARKASPPAARPGSAPARGPAGTRKAAAAAAPQGAAARLARVAKGKKPQYFSDPAIDKLLWMTLTLMEELSVTRDRLDAVENLLEGRRVLKVADVDGYRPEGAAAERRRRRRTEYVDRMLRAAQAELEELTGRDMPKTEEDVVAAVEA
jgi:hypothetical protein